MDMNRLIAERLVHNRMKNRLNESNTQLITLDPDKVERAMRSSGYQDDEILEFLYDKYGLEDGEDYQTGNGDLEFMFYSSKSADRCIADLGTTVKESNEPAPREYYKKVRDILNHRLGSYETGVSVENIEIVSETSGTITIKVDYEVHIQIPMIDPEDGRTYYEQESDYRSQTMTLDFDELDEDLSLDDDPEETEQAYSSAATSINSSKLPALFSMVDFEEGSINLDYGGGRFDNVAEYLEDKYRATNLVYDKYNRTAEHNKKVLDQVRKNGGADTVTCSNVLNVIAEESERLAVLRNCKRFLKSGGTCYITVYEGNGKGEGSPTKAGYQLNRKTKDYEDEIKKVFSSVTRRGKLFICR